MTPTQFLLLLFLLFLILAMVGLPWLLGRRREAEPWDAGPLYLAAIDGLARGRPHRAMEALRKIARHETENLAVYLRLGDLLRQTGHAEKAERIHAGLAARPIQDPALAISIRESLVEDLLAREDWVEATRLAEKLRASDRRNVTAHRALTLAGAAREDWQAAAAAVDEWERITPGKTLPRPVDLRLEAGRRLLAAGHHEEARKFLEEAARVDPGPVRIRLGDVLALLGEHEKATEVWIEHVRRNPRAPGGAFERLERSFFEMGRFGDLLPLYESLSHGSPPHVPALVALAEMHKRRGRPEEAVHLLQSLLSAEAGHPSARRLLARCLLQLGRTGEAMHELDALLDARPADHEVARCVHCAAADPDLFPRCAACGAWQPPPVSR